MELQNVVVLHCLQDLNLVFQKLEIGMSHPLQADHLDGQKLFGWGAFKAFINFAAIATSYEVGEIEGIVADFFFNWACFVHVCAFKLEVYYY